jgi:hypothetical protein
VLNNPSSDKIVYLIYNVSVTDLSFEMCVLVANRIGYARLTIILFFFRIPAVTN